MPAPVIAAFEKEFGINKSIIEKFWKFAKSQYGEDYKAITGTVKRMIKNYKKFKMIESINDMNSTGIVPLTNIEMAILALEEGCGGNCGCGGKCNKKTCKCKNKKKTKKNGVPLTGDELKSLGKFGDMIEGKSKRDLEAKAEKACTCDGGSSLDPDDHDPNCPVHEVLDGSEYGAEIDAAEYSKGDR